MVERARYEPVYGHNDGWPLGTNVKQKQNKKRINNENNKNTVVSQFIDTRMDCQKFYIRQTQMSKEIRTQMTIRNATKKCKTKYQ